MPSTFDLVINFPPIIQSKTIEEVLKSNNRKSRFKKHGSLLFDF